MFGPDATATYDLSSNMLVIGELSTADAGGSSTAA
jgi:hypothetical protein